MKHATHCKFCKKPILVTVDDEYAAMHDPLKIIPLAACNHCADLRIRRRGLHDSINRVCMSLARDSQSDDSRLKHKESLVALTKKYTALVAEWVGSKSPWWDIEIVDLLMEKPIQWPKVLQICWKMYSPEQTEALV